MKRKRVYSLPLCSGSSKAMSTALKQMTVDEFLLWAEGKEGRWELHDGVPVMMAPEQLRHTRINRARSQPCDPPGFEVAVEEMFPPPSA